MNLVTMIHFPTGGYYFLNVVFFTAENVIYGWLRIES